MRDLYVCVSIIKSACIFFSVLFLALSVLAAEPGVVAAKPLYRDPVYDGAADPVVIWNPLVKRWWMFYTNRRANVPGTSGVTWVHGTPIGIAASADGGAHWKYVGTAQFDLPAEYGGTNTTCWVPDVTRAPDGTWQMFLTIVPGIFEDWNHPRDLGHGRHDFPRQQTAVDDLVPGDGASDFPEKWHQRLGLAASIGFGQLQKCLGAAAQVAAGHGAAWPRTVARSR